MASGRLATMSRIAQRMPTLTPAQQEGVRRALAVLMRSGKAAVLDVPADPEVQEKSRKSLRHYLEHYTWPIAEPATQFVGGMHVDAICEHLEAVTKLQIRNLLILIPPRHTKSLCTSVAWPTWTWIDHPTKRFVYSSFSADLSTEHAVLSRRIIESYRYQHAWGRRFRMQTDQNIKTHYENNKRGYRISTSVGGTTIGRGGDFLVSDDPHNLKTIDSELEREDVILWYRQVWSSRLNDPKKGARVVIMQRGHERDLAGYLIEAGGYEVLKLPTEYDPKKSCSTSIGWKDPRTQEGQLLCPERFGPAEVAQAKKDMTAPVFATQHQQEPAPPEGGLFKVTKLRVLTLDTLPANVPFQDCRGWDMAATAPAPGKDPDYTVGAKVRRYANGLYVVMHVVRGRFEPSDGESLLRNSAAADGRFCRQREEQEPGSSGKKVIASHTVLLAGYDYRGEPTSGNKVTRAKPLAVQVDAGNVALLQGEWNQTFVDEFALFPNGRHDDQVDATATAFNDLAVNVAPMSAQVSWG